MNPIAHTPDPAVGQIPLSALALAPENVRKTPADAAAETELRASIAAHGLLENLVVRPDGDAGSYAVIAGGRRLAALQALADDGTLDPDRPVACLIVAEPDRQGELSLAENTMRIAMHPADQVVAFAGLVAEGIAVAAIAARFGVSEHLVEQRLRLGNAAPELLEAYRAGEIDLDILKAFAVTTDHVRQTEAWHRLNGLSYRPTVWQVRQFLTNDQVPAYTAIARFVGVDAYEEAGGTVLRDLFADEDESGVWLENPALLNELAMDALNAAADDLTPPWKWAEAMVEVDWTALARYGRLNPEPAEPTEAEKAERERLCRRCDELQSVHEEDWTDELGAEAETLEESLDALDVTIAERAAFRTEDMAIAGCIATVSRDGTLNIVRGLVKPEDMPKPAEGEGGADGGENAGGNGDTGDVHGPVVSTRPKDREAEARKEAGVGIGLADDLRAIRTALVKTHLAGDFEAAFDLLLFQLARCVFAYDYLPALAIAIRATDDRPMARANDADFAAWSPGEAMLEDRSGLSLDWLEIEDDGAAFAALRALSQGDKQVLFAACVARTVNGQLAFEPHARPELEATVARLDIGFAAHVRPTAAMYWSRIAKARILDIARQTLGATWESARAKQKKADLAQAMERAFAAETPAVGLDDAARAAAAAWTLPGFAAFDAGQVDRDPDDVDEGTDDTATAETPAETDAADDAGPADPDAETANTAASGSPLIPWFLRRNR